MKPKKRTKVRGASMDQRENCSEEGPASINQLPDDLLVDILSFLPVKQAVQASILSRRWKHIWKYIHNVQFSYTRPEYHPEYRSPAKLLACATTFLRKLLHSKDRAACDMQTFLHHHQAPKIQRFDVQFPANKGNAGQVDLWILFALNRGVGELLLDTFHGNDSLVNGDFYRIPSCVFKGQCLTELSLIQCEVQMPSSVCLPLLKTLVLKYITRSAAAVGFIISKCPSLESLSIVHCFHWERLVISVKSLRLRSLTVAHLNPIVIDAPAVQSLELQGIFSLSWNCQLRNLSSLMKIDLNFQNMSNLPSEIITHLGVSVMKMLDELHAVRYIKLSEQCIQALSTTRNKNPIMATCLELEISLTTTTKLRRIRTVLSLFPAVETLILVCKGADEPLTSQKCWKSLKHSISRLMRHIKTIEMHEFISFECISPKATLDDLWRTCEVKIELVSLVLESSTCLEKVVITLNKEEYKGLEGKSQFKMKLVEKLQNLKRASPAAKIFIF